jgi:hypothetical protein
LGELLPEIVSEAVDCPEERWTGSLGIGDIEVRFRAKTPLDVGELNCLIEVRTRLFPSRQQNLQERSDLIRDRLQAEIDLGEIGVWLVLSDAFVVTELSFRYRLGPLRRAVFNQWVDKAPARAYIQPNG